MWILCFIWCKSLESCGNSTHLCWHRQIRTCTHFSTLLVFFLQSAGWCRSLVSQRENQTLHVCHSWSAVFLATALTHVHSSRSADISSMPSPFTVILVTRDLKTNICFVCVLSVSIGFFSEIRPNNLVVLFFQYIISLYV